jgi:hypothetical protein
MSANHSAPWLVACVFHPDFEQPLDLFFQSLVNSTKHKFAYPFPFRSIHTDLRLLGWRAFRFANQKADADQNNRDDSDDCKRQCDALTER